MEVMEAIKIHREINKLGACSLYKGDETITELLRLMKTIQGMEFCIKHNFPTLKMLKSVDKDIAMGFGIYVNAGKIKLHNPENVVLVGRTSANITYDDNATIRHKVAVFHGAKVQVRASNWSVVFTTNLGGKIDIEVNENAYVR